MRQVSGFRVQTLGLGASVPVLRLSLLLLREWGGLLLRGEWFM